MKKILKKGIALLLCLAMIFNYSFSVLADENVESSEPETTYTETVEATENNETTETTESIEELESEEDESEEEVSDESSEEIIEPEDDNENIEDAYEKEPEEALGDTFDEPIEDKEDIENTEPEDKLENNDVFIGNEKDTKINSEVDVKEETKTEDIEEASPSEAEEEIENETKIEEDVEESTPSDIDEILDDIEEATPSEIVDTPTDYFIREVIVDNIKITLTADKGVFPENAELSVEKVEDEYTNEAVDEAINKTKNGEENKTTTFKFDIKMFLDGEEIQPDLEKGTVKVAFTFEEKIENSENINAYHLKEDINGDLTAEKLNTEVTTDDTDSEKEVTKIEAETDGFSIYAIELPNSMFGATGPHPTVNYDGQNWMSHIPDSSLIGYIAIPGTHDSGTSKIRFNQTNGLRAALRNAIINGVNKKFAGKILALIVDMVEPALEPFFDILIQMIQTRSGTCQDLTIEEQLYAGVRAFDFRFRYDSGSWGVFHGCDNDGSLQSVFTTCVCYGPNNQKLDLYYCFNTIRTFINSHPSEVIFLNVQNEGGGYNKEIEKQLLEFERNYGFCVNYAKREFSQTVLNENPSYKITVPSGELGRTTLNNWRGKVIDITDALDLRMSAWSETKEKALGNALGYVMARNIFGANPIMGELQTNVMVKLYNLNDPHGECGLPFDIEWLGSVPIFIKFNLDKTIISPYAQASYINPRFLNDLKTAGTGVTDPEHISAYGIITMDFQSKHNCYTIVQKNLQIPGGPNFQWVDGEEPLVPGEIPLDEDEYYTINIPYPEGYIEYLNSLLNKGNSSSRGSGSSGGTPRYDSEGNVLGPSGKQNYTYDGTNPPNLTGNINVSSWNYATGTSQSNNIQYVQNTDSFIRADNTPVVTEWVGVTTNDIGKVMWYRTDATGKILKNQFIQIGTNIYYLDNNGIMVTGQYTINGKVYNFETAVGATEGRFLY